ncbi:MAG: U32 family peptidase [Selenomonadaceae bacterium]|nr:U32 family peptidase [Selenomonadaceae bacterium]
MELGVWNCNTTDLTPNSKLQTPNCLELLAPAGNFEKLQAALIYGADAVYFGGKDFSLRAYGDNFTRAEILQAVDFTHKLGKKIYAAVNIFAHNADLDALADYLKFLDGAGVDAILVSDTGVLSLAKELTALDIHISTQANVTNRRAAKFFHDLGAKRIVLARELTREEIADIKSNCAAELEIFVHGAMCISYSGRCWLSKFLTGRDANQGACTHSCRWKYQLVEETRDGEFFPVGEDNRGAYVMNSKDLCLLPYLDKVIQSGVASLKIEGRMKSVNYVAGVVKVYRAAIDSYFADPENFSVRDEWLAELDKVAHRPYTTGFFTGDGLPTEIYSTSKPKRSANFLGIVRAFDSATMTATIEQRGKFSVGERVEFLQPKGETFTQTITSMRNEDGSEISAAPHAQQLVTLPVDKPVEIWSLMREES